MSRRINTKQANFLKRLNALMKRRAYNNTYTEQDMQHAELIGAEKPEPVMPPIKDRSPSSKRLLNKINTRRTINEDAFEKEYEAFIANLKAQKHAQEENKVEEVTNVPETNVETTQAAEETPVVEDKPKKTRKKKEVVETVQEEPVIEEQTESPVMEDDGQIEGEKSELTEFGLN